MTMNFHRQSAIKILRTSHVLEILSISASTLYDWMNKKSPRYDATFPEPISIGHNNAWHEQQLIEWIDMQTKKERKCKVKNKG